MTDYNAKLAQLSMACVACLADLVCRKREELPDRIVPRTAIKLMRRLIKSQGVKKYEG